MIDKIKLYFNDFKNIIINNKFKKGWQENNVNGYVISSLYHKYNTKVKEKCIWESHRKIIDLQFCYSGSEIIYFSEYKNLFKRDKYLKNIDKDVWFFNKNLHQYIILKPNTFVIFQNECLHLPQVKTKTDYSIEKIVLKIPKDMFEN